MSELSKLDQELKQGKLSQIYLFFGDEKYDLKLALEKIKKQFDNLTIGVNLFYLNKENISELNSICENVTFLGDKKLVVIKDTGLKFDIDSMIESVTSGTVVVIIESDVDKRLSQYKKLVKFANIVEFNHLNQNDMVKYIIQILEKYNIKISYEDAQYMAMVCGEDKQNNINELQKLVLYLKSGDTVTKEIIDKVCSKTLSAKIFDMLDKVVNKDNIGAINDLDQLLMLKEPIVKIYVMLYKQILQMYMIKLLKLNNTKNIPEQLGIHPFVFRKLNYSCDKYSIDELKNILYLFDEYDEKTKTGDMDFEIGLKKIICLI